MTKYYRVRTQEQWDWLMQRFEKQSKNIKWENGKKPLEFCPTFNSSVKEKAIYLDGNQLTWGSAKYALDSGYCLIEVSQMMEDEKMEDYVTISRDDLFQIEDQDGEGIVQVDGKGEFSIPDMPIDEISIPKSLLYPKVRMSVVEKKEFGELKNNCTTLYEVLHDIDYEKEPKLYSRLFIDIDRERNDSQLEFARAWVDPSLIEIIPEKKWEVKVPCAPDHYYFKDTDNELIVSYASDGTESRKQFTSKELKHYGLDNDLFEKVEVSE